MTAVLTAGLTVFLGLSLYSYNPQDPSLNSFGLFPKVLNYCGFVGAVTADIFYQLTGFASWLFIPAGLRTAYKFFVSRLQTPFWLSLLFFMLFILSFAGLLELHFPQIRFFEGGVSLGGVLGQSAVAVLKPRLHFAGTAVVLWSGFFTVILSHIEVSFRSLWRSLKRFFIALPRFAGKISLGGKLLFSSGLRLLIVVWAFLWRETRRLLSLIAKGVLKASGLWRKKTGRFKSIFGPSRGAPLEGEKQIPPSSISAEVKPPPSRAELAEGAPASLGSSVLKKPESPLCPQTLNLMGRTGLQLAFPIHRRAKLWPVLPTSWETGRIRRFGSFPLWIFCPPLRLKTRGSVLMMWRIFHANLFPSFPVFH